MGYLRDRLWDPWVLVCMSKTVRLYSMLHGRRVGLLMGLRRSYVSTRDKGIFKGICGVYCRGSPHAVVTLGRRAFFRGKSFFLANATLSDEEDYD